MIPSTPLRMPTPGELERLTTWTTATGFASWLEDTPTMARTLLGHWRGMGLLELHDDCVTGIKYRATPETRRSVP